MKDKIITLVIGMLIGGIITAGVFLIVKPGRGSNMPDFGNMTSFDRSSRKRPEGYSRRGNYTTTDENVTSKDEINEN